MIDRSTKQKFWNKRVNARAEGIEFKLTLDEFVELMKAAGITTDDLHIKGYHLARYEDSGSYEVGNCRFVHYLVNYGEKKVSPKAREASRRNAIKMNTDRWNIRV